MTRVTAALLASVATMTPAFADTAVGLVGDKTLVMIDTKTAAVSATMEVTGVDRLLGIDWRPGNMTLVGVTADHTIVTIDPATGAATEVAKMNVMLPATDGPVVVISTR